MSVAKAPGKSSHTQVLTKHPLPLPHISESLSAIVGQRSEAGYLSAVAARQVTREDASAARAKASSGKIEIRRNPITPTTAPRNPNLIANSGSGPGSTFPSGADTQGPSPVDFNLELEAEFQEDMVLEMQGNSAKKTRRTVIGWTLGGRTTFKTLHECLKLHLPVSFISATLLTRGYFLILFKNEEGAIATRKLTSMEWSRLSLSFSRYTPSFDASAQGAKALLTHTIKVQFPDLHKQFRNIRALTIMASKLDEVFDIEAVDSYVKRPAGPMVTIKINDITKLVGYIRIPSMAEGVSTMDTICQWILYSELPNQC
jgi:hypothetical protein